MTAVPVASRRPEEPGVDAATRCQSWGIYATATLVGEADDMEYPHIYLDYKGKSWLYTPFAHDNKQWLWTFNGLRSWTKKYDPRRRLWEIPKGHVEILIDACILKWGGVHVSRRHKRSVVCTASCRTAKRELCECSCKGQFIRRVIPATRRASDGN
jgi:hypothetical protein